VDTVLRFSRIQRGVQRFAPVRADAVEVVRALLDRYRPHLEESGFTLHAQLPGITVSLARQGEAVAIAVQDRGIGIAPDQHARIFESFYRLEAHATKGTRGTGIGLALVKEIVAAHNGRITVESTPGQGATFTVSLPAG
jgi:signal transduction histidine kinase